MTDIVQGEPIVRISEASPVAFGIVKITRRDGYVGVVDLRPVIASGEMFEFLRADPERFGGVQTDEYGHRLFWLNDDGGEIDFGTASLRMRSERQDELHRLVG